MPRDPEPHPANRPAAGRKRVLIVDDIPETTAFLTTLLAALPELEVAGSAATGLEAIDEACRLLPDLILMDLMMPELYGIAATKRIHETWPDIRIVVMSVQSDRSYLDRSAQAGACDYLVKPFTMAELADAVATALGENVAKAVPRATRPIGRGEPYGSIAAAASAKQRASRPGGPQASAEGLTSRVRPLPTRTGATSASKHRPAARSEISWKWALGAALAAWMAFTAIGSSNSIATSGSGGARAGAICADGW